MTGSGNPKLPDAESPRMTAPKRVIELLVTLAYLVMAAWFAWLLVDEDGIPREFAAASLAAAAIVVIDVGSRLFRGRKDADRRQ